MATTEHTINDAIAGILRESRSIWRNQECVSSENTGMLKGNSKRPDILVIEPNVSPVCVETELAPAITLESDATGRLGEHLKTTGRAILSSIAVRLPVRFKDKSGKALKKELECAVDFEFALYTGSSALVNTRWPGAGWLLGSLQDLSLLIQSATVPPDVIDDAVDHLVAGVSETAGLITEIATHHAGAINSIAAELRQQDGQQTRRMASTILANAFIFHESLAGGPGDLSKVLSIDQLRGSKEGFSKASVLEQWRAILKVNYWPIFDIARRILEHIPAADSAAVLQRLSETAGKLLENRLMRSHDLTGAVFQRMIVDRKFLAAFYTTPASAALLVGLAVSAKESPSGGAWSSVEDVRSTRLADFACGTGTLLTTAYQRIGQLHELAGATLKNFILT